MLIGGIDIGSNTLRLMVGRVEAQKVEAIRFERKITRLGEGVAQTGRLSEDGMNRSIQALKEFCGVLRDFSVKEVAVVGTSALRSSNNQEFFLKKVDQETGLKIEVISGEEEAKRTFDGIVFGSEGIEGEFCVLDIGGGSTEIIIGRKKEIENLKSLYLGVVSLTERYLKSDPIQQKEVQELREEIIELLKEIPFLYQRESQFDLIGTAGTLTTLGAICQGLGQFDRRKIHNQLISKVFVENVLTDLVSKTLTQRRNIPGLEPGREDVIVPGVLILLCVMDLLGVSKVKISDYGLLEGIILHRAEQLGLVES
ncbi:MAG TPA: Ppx/GppA phosphatase family protein [Nitrospiria bacterium]